jgi:hypothetical protein
MDLTGLDVNLQVAGHLAEKIMSFMWKKSTFCDHFGEFDKVQAVLEKVKLVYTPLTGAVAETSRNTEADTDFTIRISDNFEKHFREQRAAAENDIVLFFLALIIAHEICHLILRRDGKMHTPEKLAGLYGPEAGEFFEKFIIGGVSRLRLSNFCRNAGWNPSTMHPDALVIELGLKIFKELCSREISEVVQCAKNRTPFRPDVFPITVVGGGRKVGFHVLKETSGAHECRGHGAFRDVPLRDKDFHIYVGKCAFSGCKRKL